MKQNQTEMACSFMAWSCSHPGSVSPRKGRSGLTLVELMLAVSLASLVMVGIAAATITVGRMLYRNMAEAEVTQSIRTIEGTLARDVRSARTLSLAGDRVLLDLGFDQIEYFTVSKPGGHTELVRLSSNGTTRRYFLRNVTQVNFTTSATAQPELFMNVQCHIRIGGGNDVWRTFSNRFASRVQ